MQKVRARPLATFCVIILKRHQSEMMINHLAFEFNRATKDAYRRQEKTFTDPLSGTLYVWRVAELLKKIEEVLEG